MDKQTLLDELYRSKKVGLLMEKIPVEFASDLKQEVFMLLLIRPDIEILDLAKRGKLYSYFAKLIYNQLFWNRSNFHILYNTFEFKEKRSDVIPDIPDEPGFDITEEIEDAMDKLSPYHEKLMRLYAEHGTYRAVGEFTGIAWKSVYNAVTNARTELKQTIKL